jgi:hypothetical protein
MGYIPPQLPPRLNLDRHGMPRDYATYVWLLYRRHVEDGSPARRAFLEGTDRQDGSNGPPDFGLQMWR